MRSICHRYMCIVLYIFSSAIRSAKFGVAVFKAIYAQLKGVKLSWVYVHCAIYGYYLV